MAIEIERLTYNKIKQYALQFLDNYNKEEKIPIPIEDIIDVRLGINIIPVPDLGNFYVDAYTWSDLKNILVDKFFYDKRPRRYRFTLAHEIGHILLHANILKSNKVNSVDDYLEFVNNIGAEDHRWAEWQADCFAGLVLVPPRPLELKFREAQRKIRVPGIPFKDPIIYGYIADWISDYFEVSQKVVETRLVYDNLIPRQK